MEYKQIKLKRRSFKIKLVSLSEMAICLGAGERQKKLIDKYQIPCEFDKSGCLLARTDLTGPSLATYDEYLENELLDRGFDQKETEQVWKLIHAEVQGLH